MAATQKTAVYRGDKVTIEEWLDDTIHIVKKEIELSYIKLSKQPKAIKMKVTALTAEKPHWKLPADHPWKHGF